MFRFAEFSSKMSLEVSFEIFCWSALIYFSHFFSLQAKWLISILRNEEGHVF